MKFRFVSVALAVLALANNAFSAEYLDGPIEQWAVDTGKDLVAGNSVSVSPDDSHVFVTTEDGTMIVINAETQAIAATVTAGDLGLGDTTCESGITFYEDEDETYAMYAVYVAASQSSYLVRTKADGTEAKVSQVLEGKAIGSPVISSDGTLAFINTNINNNGIFNCVTTDTMLHQYIKKDAATDPNPARGAPGPFAPIGYYHNPSEGYYNIDNNSGAVNNNDVLFWANGYPEGAGQTGNKNGARYVFQIPLDWKRGNSNLGFQVYAAQRNGWVTYKAPAMFDEGKSAIYGTTRNAFKGWVATAAGGGKWQEGITVTTDSDGDGQFGRGQPRWAAPYTTPVITEDDGSGYVVSGTAGNAPALAVMKLPGLLTVETFNSGSSPLDVVKAQPVLSPDKDRVYWMSNGDSVLYATSLPKDDPTSVENAFSAQIMGAAEVNADMSLSSDGVYLYIGGGDGTIIKVAVASGDTASPTVSQVPSPSPTTSSPTVSMMPSTSEPTVTPLPSSSPSAGPTGSPTKTPAPVVTASDAPSASPSKMPTPSPTASPTAPPTTAPVAPPTPPTDTAEPTGTPTDSPTPSPTEAEGSASAAVSTMAALGVAMAAALFL